MIIPVIFLIFTMATGVLMVDVDFGAVDVSMTSGNLLPRKYTPLTADDETATRNGMSYANNVIAHATTGLDAVPVLDPFYMDVLPPVPISHRLIRGTVYLRNLNITGIKNTVLDQLKIRMKNGRFDAEVSGRGLNIEVDYKADFRIGFLPFSYAGHVSVSLKNAQATVMGSVTKKSYNGVPVFQLGGLVVLAHVDDVMLTIDKLLWETVSKMVSLDEIRDDTGAAVMDSFVTQANILMRAYPAQKVLQYLLGTN